MSKRDEELMTLLQMIRAGESRASQLTLIDACIARLQPTRQLLRRHGEAHDARPKLPRAAIFERDQWCCVYCDEPISLDSGHVDHVVPRSRGGSDDPSNLAAACVPCNLSKGARTPEEWLQ